MSIATEISRIQQAKADIKSSIEAKGVTVPSAALIDDYSDYVDAIQTGGGGGNQDLIDLIERDIRTLNIPSGTTNIGNYAFKSLSRLNSVTIPNSVTRIGEYAFEDCGNITSIDISDNIVSIGVNAFNNCARLERVNIESLEGWCGIAFFGIQGNPLANGKHLYMNGSEILNLVIPSTVTSINNYTFSNGQFTSLVIPNNVTTIGQQSFYHCDSLSSITFGSGLTTIGIHSFRNCASLTSLVIPENITDIGTYAFNNCTGLTSITVEATTPPTLGSGAFTNTNDCPIYVPAASVDTYKAASGWSTYASRIHAIPSE